MVHCNLQIIFGKRIYQYLAAVTSTLSILSCEMHYGWPSPSLPTLTNGTYHYQITPEEASWVAVSLLIGNIVGALAFSIIGQILGRKTIILITSIPLFVAWILISFSHTVIELIAARVLAGISSGVSFSVLPIYLGEIADPKLRGMLSSACSICVVFGSLLVNVLGNHLEINEAALISSVFPFVLFGTFIWMPESPWFYYLQGKEEQCKKSVKTLTGNELTSEDLEKLKVSFEEYSTGTGKFIELLQKPCNRKALLIALGLRTIQQFGGSTPITFYCKTIFNEMADYISPNLATGVYFFVQLLVVFLSTLIVDLTGRKPLLVISVIGSSLMLCLTGAHMYIKSCTNFDTTPYNFIPFAALVLYVIFFSIGLRAVPLVMLGEIFPSNIKIVGLTVTTIFHSGISIIASKLFYFTSKNMYVFFFILTACGGGSLLFIWLCVPETKGKSLEEIQVELRGGKRIEK